MRLSITTQTTFIKKVKVKINNYIMSLEPFVLDESIGLDVTLTTDTDHGCVVRKQSIEVVNNTPLRGVSTIGNSSESGIKTTYSEEISSFYRDFIIVKKKEKI